MASGETKFDRDVKKGRRTPLEWGNTGPRATTIDEGAPENGGGSAASPAEPATTVAEPSINQTEAPAKPTTETTEKPKTKLEVYIDARETLIDAIQKRIGLAFSRTNDKKAFRKAVAEFTVADDLTKIVNGETLHIGKDHKGSDIHFDGIKPLGVAWKAAFKDCFSDENARRTEKGKTLSLAEVDKAETYAILSRVKESVAVYEREAYTSSFNQVLSDIKTEIRTEYDKRAKKSKEHAENFKAEITTLAPANLAILLSFTGRGAIQLGGEVFYFSSALRKAYQGVVATRTDYFLDSRKPTGKGTHTSPVKEKEVIANDNAQLLSAVRTAFVVSESEASLMQSEIGPLKEAYETALVEFIQFWQEAIRASIQNPSQLVKALEGEFKHGIKNLSNEVVVKLYSHRWIKVGDVPLIFDKKMRAELVRALQQARDSYRIRAAKPNERATFATSLLSNEVNQVRDALQKSFDETTPTTDAVAPVTGENAETPVTEEPSQEPQTNNKTETGPTPQEHPFWEVARQYYIGLAHELRTYVETHQKSNGQLKKKARTINNAAVRGEINIFNIKEYAKGGVIKNKKLKDAQKVYEEHLLNYLNSTYQPGDKGKWSGEAAAQIEAFYATQIDYSAEVIKNAFAGQRLEDGEVSRAVKASAQVAGTALQRGKDWIQKFAAERSPKWLANLLGKVGWQRFFGIAGATLIAGLTGGSVTIAAIIAFIATNSRVRDFVSGTFGYIWNKWAEGADRTTDKKEIGSVKDISKRIKRRKTDRAIAFWGKSFTTIAAFMGLGVGARQGLIALFDPAFLGNMAVNAVDGTINWATGTDLNIARHTVDTVAAGAEVLDSGIKTVASVAEDVPKFASDAVETIKTVATRADNATGNYVSGGAKMAYDNLVPSQDTIDEFTKSAWNDLVPSQKTIDGYLESVGIDSQTTPTDPKAPVAPEGSPKPTTGAPTSTGTTPDTQLNLPIEAAGTNDGVTQMIQDIKRAGGSVPQWLRELADRPEAFRAWAIENGLLVDGKSTLVPTGEIWQVDAKGNIVVSPKLGAPGQIAITPDGKATSVLTNRPKV